MHSGPKAKETGRLKIWGGDIERKMKLKTEESLEVKEQKKMILSLLIQKPFASN